MNGDFGCRFLFIAMNFERPTYLINADICKANIAAMAEKAARSGVIFRPHFKTHQSLKIGEWFRKEGVSRITTSSLSAARYFADGGWPDITIAFPVNLREIDLINHLASRQRIGLLLEHHQTAELLIKQLLYPVDVYIKIDTGYHRTGLSMEEMPLISKLAGVIRDSKLMTLKGLLTHAGHTYNAESKEEIRSIYHSSVQTLLDVSQQLGNHEEPLILSYGDTPACSVMESFSFIHEIRPGNFVFYDLMQLAAGGCQLDQLAGIVVCPVVAVHPSRNQAVIYGGAIHLSKEPIQMNGRRIYGQLIEMDDQGWYNPLPEAYVISLSQEHGIIEAPERVIRDLHPGMVVGIIPVHACLVSNLLQEYTFLNGEKGDYFKGF